MRAWPTKKVPDLPRSDTPNAPADSVERPFGLDGAITVIAGMPRVEYMLRRLLALRLSGSTGYFDDGELQDNSKRPSIDFLRDHPKDIDLKLAERRRIARDELATKAKDIGNAGGPKDWDRW